MSDKAPLRVGDVVRTTCTKWSIYMGRGIWFNSQGKVRYCPMFTFVERKKALKGELERA